MKICVSTNRECGLTLIEVSVLIAVITFFALLLIPAHTSDKARAYRIQCANNLKQVGLAFRIWEGGCDDKYPMRISTERGGTMEFITGPNAFHHFQVMSNELSTPKVLFCPAESDRARIQATTFNLPLKPGEILFTSNSNLSYFVGIDASESDPQGILSGDNLTNGMSIKDGILELTTNQLAGWTAELHNK